MAKHHEQAALEDSAVVEKHEELSEPEPVPARKKVRLSTAQRHRTLRTPQGTVNHEPQAFDPADADAIRATAERCGIPLIVSDDHE